MTITNLRSEPKIVPIIYDLIEGGNIRKVYLAPKESVTILDNVKLAGMAKDMCKNKVISVRE
jgi:hypothetical protein